MISRRTEISMHLPSTSSRHRNASSSEHQGETRSRPVSTDAHQYHQIIRLAPGTAPVQIVTTTLPNERMNETYAQTLSCTEISTSCAWILNNGSLPQNLTLNAVAAV